MEPNFSFLFHQASKDHGKGHPPISSDYTSWPEEWRTTYYKVYPRFPKIDLDDRSISADLFALIKKRQSRRNFSKEKNLSKRELSILLKYSCGITKHLDKKRWRRAHPSGGGRYPLEIYPVVFRSSKEVRAGLYHYNIRDHTLDVLWNRELSDSDIHQLFVYPWVKDALAAVVMTSVFWRTQNKYGERGYRYILLEAGHVGQNIYLISEALGLKCCAMGTHDDNIEGFLDIDGVTESVVYALVIGK